jgi:hypothetical protein
MDDARTPARQIPSLAIAAWAAASVTLLALASAYDLPISEVRRPEKSVTAAVDISHSS